MQIYVTDAAAYRDALKEIGAAYRRHFGRHYPAIGLFEVQGLFDPGAKVELMCIAVVPDPGA
jgi:enamine deaminase RidA (YjgF/YER057c/UK114 family)